MSELSQPEMKDEALSSQRSRLAASINSEQVGITAAEREAPSKTIDTVTWPIDDTIIMPIFSNHGDGPMIRYAMAAIMFPNTSSVLWHLNRVQSRPQIKELVSWIQTLIRFHHF